MIKLAIFDFDGTVIDGSSPVRLIRRLALMKIMPLKATRKAFAWGVRYKLGHELDQSAPRMQIFQSLSKHSASEADAIMSRLYRDELAPLLRPGVREFIAKLQADGLRVILLSASFTPILEAATTDIPFDAVIGTRMEIKDGIYTGAMLGPAPEGEQKAIQLSDYANKQYGEGNWEVEWAFGDHISDVPVLKLAKHPVTIEPNSTLRRYARRHSCPVRQSFCEDGMTI
jgi:HAD superfamily hydrolase (TIGR01490 family)